VNQHPGIIGIKMGMTQFFQEDGSVVQCTVVRAGCVIVGKRTRDKDGYDALVLGLGERKDKHASRAVRGVFAKRGVRAPRTVRELRASAEHVARFEVGQTLRVEDVFEVGQLVDVQSRTKGRGFTGVVKRWGFAGVNATHGTHEWRRHGGSIGTNMTPGRTLPGRKMCGQYGNETVSTLNQRIARILPDEQVIYIEGSVPGPREGVVRVLGAIKKRGGKGIKAHAAVVEE
jgi:large subunit ribosomal protein L3